MNAARQFVYLMDEEKNFLKTLLYFDLFNYPLTADEIIQYSSGLTYFPPDRLLQNLISQKMLFQFQNFYSLQNDPALVLRRLRGNARAEKKLKTAKIFSRLVYFLPFVRAVMLSGSISKGYMDEKSDIDYFIITEKNRLWLVRTALALFRRAFLFNSGKNLCTNYFIDTQNLEIQEKNIFTAIELVTLKPMCGSSEILKFRMANPWAFSFLPNIPEEKASPTDTNHLLKAVIEIFFSSSAIDRFNQWLMNKIFSYWKQRYGYEMDATDFRIAFRSTPGISRSHPQFFQKKILTRYDQKIREFEIQYGIDLSL